MLEKIQTSRKRTAESAKIRKEKPAKSRTVYHTKEDSQEKNDRHILRQTKLPRNPSFNADTEESAFIVKKDSNYNKFESGLKAGYESQHEDRKLLIDLNLKPTWYNLGYVIAYRSGTKGITQIHKIIKEIAQHHQFVTFRDMIDHIDLLIEKIKERAKDKTDYSSEKIDTDQVGSATLGEAYSKDFSVGLKNGWDYKTQNKAIRYPAEGITNWYQLGHFLGYRTKSSACPNMIAVVNIIVDKQKYITFRDIINNIEFFLNQTIAELAVRKKDGFQKYKPKKETNKDEIIKINVPGSARLSDSDQCRFKEGIISGAWKHSYGVSYIFPTKEAINSWYSFGYYVGFSTASKAVATYTKAIKQFNEKYPNATFEFLINEIVNQFNICTTKTQPTAPVSVRPQYLCALSSSSFFYDREMAKEVSAEWEDLNREDPFAIKEEKREDKVWEMENFILEFKKNIQFLKEKNIYHKCHSTSAYLIDLIRALLLDLNLPNYNAYANLNAETSKVEISYQEMLIKCEDDDIDPSIQPSMCVAVAAKNGLNSGITNLSTRYIEIESLENSTYLEHVTTILDNDTIEKTKTHKNHLTESLKKRSLGLNQLLIGHIGLVNRNIDEAGHGFAYLATPEEVYFIDADLLHEKSLPECVFKQNKLNDYYDFSGNKKKRSTNVVFFPEVFYAIHHLLPLDLIQNNQHRPFV